MMQLIKKIRPEPLTISTFPKALPVDRLIFVVLMLLIVIMAARVPIDVDMWWHLGAGQEILRSGKPLVTDIFSYTRYGAPWVSHSWLGELGMYWLFQQLGFLGIGAIVALLAAAGMAFVYFAMRGVPPILRAFVIVLACLVAAPVWTARPQLASLVVFSMVNYLIYLFKWEGKDRLWLLPLIFCFWSNLHGGYFLGFVLIAVVIGGEILNHIFGYRDSSTLQWKSIFYIAIWTLISLFTVLINPNGIETWLIPFKTFEVSTVQIFISEWASPDFYDPTQIPFMVMLLSFIIVFALSEKRKDIGEVLIVVVFAAMALIARRSFGIFAIATAPILGRYLWIVIEEWVRRSDWLGVCVSKFGKETVMGAAQLRWMRVVNLCIVALLGLAAIGKVYVTTFPALINAQLPAAYPVDAVNWLKSEPVETELFNEYDWGGYLIWELPSYRVFVDGRTDLYAGEVLDQWVTVVNAKEGWQEILDGWQVKRVLVYPYRPIVSLLKEAGWKTLYSNANSIVLGRN